MDKQLNEIAQAILIEAGEKLQALGLYCTLSPLSLPQGVSLTLHVGESKQATASAYVALGRGGEQAHTKVSAEAFAEEVADVLAEDVISFAARRPS